MDPRTREKNWTKGFLGEGDSGEASTDVAFEDYSASGRQLEMNIRVAALGLTYCQHQKQCRILPTRVHVH